MIGTVISFDETTRRYRIQLLNKIIAAKIDHLMVVVSSGDKRLYKSKKMTMICQRCSKFQSDEPDERFKKCGACKSVNYCSPACQRADWKKHKTMCAHMEVNAVSAFPDRKAFIKWNDSRRVVMSALFVRFISLAQADSLLLIVHVVPDTDPNLDGFRIVSHTVENMATLSAFMPCHQAQYVQQNVADESYFLLRIFVVLKFGDADNDSTYYLFLTILSKILPFFSLSANFCHLLASSNFLPIKTPKSAYDYQWIQRRTISELYLMINHSGSLTK